MKNAMGKRGLYTWCGLFVLLLMGSCRPNRPAAPPAETLFTALPPAYTGIDFVNRLDYTEAYNPYTFRNFYNGGGVGLGDLNNDGLVDIFFCGNLVDNKLYLNRGDFRFEDVTEQAGVASSGVWTAGVALADVNGDGWLDIYLCKSGDPSGENRHNELFINNGAGPDGQVTFTERAAEYGIDDLGLSTHGAFFDYDRDGDLDLYLLNNSIRSVGGYDLRKNQRAIRDPQGGNKLYRNDSSPAGVKAFTDVSAEAGIYGSNIGFGLGVTIGDVNRDGWPDIYVSNDFFERDYLYINNRDGAFTESLEQYMREISLSSMGADMADLNNDGYPEVFVTDMLPAGDARMKTKTAFENWDKYRMNVENGYYRQFTRNVLQLNNGDSTFSEVGRLAGVYATDWSWGALLFDMDNDGRRDIFVANGIYKDLTDQDYVNFYSDPATVRAIMSRKKGVITDMIDAIPSQAVPNYAFRNEGGLEFVNRAAEWGLSEPSFSNGSAYADLDNDGDLDLVTNNVNMPPGIFRNNARQVRPDSSHYLTLDLRGEGLNTFAIGAQATLWAGGQVFFQELFPMRGFQSCVDYRLHYGLGAITRVDSLLVAWPDGRVTRQREVAVDQMLRLEQRGAVGADPAPAPLAPAPVFRRLTGSGIDYRHLEDEHSDFDRERLIYHMLSADGPCTAAGDVNGDGRTDLFIGGARDQAGALFVQQPDGRFRRSNEALFEKDKASEDTGACFFDADGDGDLDLYVCSGSNAFSANSSALIDRLYLNDGRGAFRRSEQVLPTFNFEPTSCVDAADFDGDGDLDLFVGVRLRSGLYGVPANGYVLENDGRGQFRDVTAAVAPGLLEFGLFTGARWLDADGDGDPDLVVAGEWGPVGFFRNEGGRLVDATETAGLAATHGLWSALDVADLDGDGDLDLVLGNHGRNTRFKASSDRPLRMYVNDFDRNGSAEQVITIHEEERAYPLALLHDLVKQMPGLRKKYLKYESYKNQTITDIFTPGQLERAIMREVHMTETAVAINNGDGVFTVRPLPVEAQLAPVFGIAVRDFDGDGHADLLLGGNFHYAKPEVGIYASSYGLWLRGDGRGGFTPAPARASGFRVTGQVRDLALLRAGGRNLVVVARNDEPAEVFEYGKQAFVNLK